MTLPLIAYTEAEVGSDVSFPHLWRFWRRAILSILIISRQCLFTPRELLPVYGGRKCLAAFCPGL